MWRTDVVEEREEDLQQVLEQYGRLRDSIRQCHATIAAYQDELEHINAREDQLSQQHEKRK